MATHKQYWYMTYTGECPVCGRSMGWRERRYTPKPKDHKDRYEQLPDTQTYDYCDQ